MIQHNCYRATCVVACFSEVLIVFLCCSWLVGCGLVGRPGIGCRSVVPNELIMLCDMWTTMLNIMHTQVTEPVNSKCSSLLIIIIEILLLLVSHDFLGWF